MKLASKSACVLVLAAAFFAGKANQASALPIHSFAAPSEDLIVQVICKYGSGQCPNNFKQKGPDTEKKGPQDPTVDPDCKAYGSCYTGPNGEEPPPAAKKGATTTKPIVIGGVKGASSKSGGGAPSNSGNSAGHSKGP